MTNLTRNQIDAKIAEAINAAGELAWHTNEPITAVHEVTTETRTRTIFGETREVPDYETLTMKKVKDEDRQEPYEVEVSRIWVNGRDWGADVTRYVDVEAQRSGGTKWRYGQPTGKLLLKVRDHEYKTKVYPQRKDGSFDWAGIAERLIYSRKLDLRTKWAEAQKAANADVLADVKAHRDSVARIREYSLPVYAAEAEGKVRVVLDWSKGAVMDADTAKALMDFLAERQLISLKRADEA